MYVFFNVCSVELHRNIFEKKNTQFYYKYNSVLFKDCQNENSFLFTNFYSKYLRAKINWDLMYIVYMVKEEYFGEILIIFILIKVGILGSPVPDTTVFILALSTGRLFATVMDNIFPLICLSFISKHLVV